ERVKAAAQYRDAAARALRQAYGEILKASDCLLQASLNHYRLPRALSEEASALMRRREELTREREQEIDAALWQTWHEACGLHLLGEQQRLYHSLARNTSTDWLPFIE